MICEECVFHKAIVERGQDVCCRHDDLVEGIKACVKVDMRGVCVHKMTRSGVLRMAAELEAKKRERDRARELLDVVQRTIAGMLKGGDACAKEEVKCKSEEGRGDNAAKI